MEAHQTEPSGPGRMNFAALKAAAMSLAGIVALTGLVILVALRFFDAGSVHTVIEDIAALIFAVGLVQILFEAYLHVHLSEEILSRVDSAVREMSDQIKPKLEELEAAVQLDKSIGPSGLRRISTSSVDWENFIEGSAEIVFVPWDLDSWVPVEWRAILDRAETNRIEVGLYLPNPSTQYQAAFETRLGLPEEFELRQKTLIKQVIDGWKAKSRIRGSSLQLHTYDAPVGFGLLMTEDSWALSVPPILGPSPGQSSLAALARNGQDTTYRNWLETQVDNLDAQPFELVEI